MTVDISSIRGFEWDEGNIDKSLKKYRIHIKETEEAFFNEPLIIDKDIKHSNNEQRYHALGKTDENRLLFISFTIRKSKIRVISARKQSKKERNEYEKHQES